ncbi:hypothetical protein N9O16_06120 [Candidatus Poseidoniaceae archaeon]|nr:hypothetical protein [Candidatus Poseidoniaceae archaeon]
MRNAICLMVVALLTLQVSLSGIDIFEDKNNGFEENTDENVNFAGRQSNGMNGNNSTVSNCNFIGISDGMGGPLWDNASTYAADDIVEWPANSGQFWQSTTSSITGEPTPNGKWIGPCSCSEIAEASGIQWQSNSSYNAWQIVHHNGSVWMAQDAGTYAGDEPVAGTDLWIECSSSSPCADVIGMTVTVWQNSTLVSEGDVYEFPAQSGTFYQIAGVGMNNQTVGEPGVDLDAWDSEFCDCKDIWGASGMPVWDSSVNYIQQAVVEWPAGSNNLYISYDHGAGVEPGGSDDYLWRSCDGLQPSGNLCEDLNGYGGMPWMNSTLVTTGEIYEFPAGSGVFHAVAPGFSNQTVGAPGSDFQSWSKDSCSCKDIWEAALNPVWDSNTVYTVGALVEYPAGTGDIWMAIVSQTTTGVTPDQAFADGNQWEVCGGEQPTGGPCGGTTSAGVWDNISRVSTGEVYEYPAGSQNYYEVVIQGYVDQDVSSPLIDLDVWAPVDCPCEETWMDNGEPVWTANTSYLGSDVVEWPAGSGHLYVTTDATGISANGGEPGIDIHWILCSESDEPANGTPCAGLTIVGVWDSSMNVTSGEIYEYPVNSGTYYQVNAGSPFWNVSAPDIDMDVWSPIDCPCKETWVANGQPAWLANTAYAGNYVVEHPAGSGNLYIPLESLGVSIGAGEPGVDTHWVLCDGTGPSPGPCEGITTSGVWNSTTMVSVGDIYQYPANSGMYYQVTQVDPNGMVSTAPGEDQAYEFWTPYACPCKTTWVANGQPVWDDTISFYSGNYVVEWPANSGLLYISEAGGITGAGEPGIDGHWIPCEENLVVEPEPIEPDADSLPSLSVALTMLGILSASAFVGRTRVD